MGNIKVFEDAAQKYDQWFDEKRHAYESELLALKKFVPERETDWGSEWARAGLRFLSASVSGQNQQRQWRR